MTSERIEKMDQALRKVVELIKTQLANEPNPAFELHQLVHPLTCAEECIFAGAQRIRVEAENVLASARSMDDYYLEKAALLLVELFKSNEQLARYTAELNQTYASADAVNELVPWLKQVAEDGHHMFSNLVEKGIISDKPDNR